MDYQWWAGIGLVWVASVVGVGLTILMLPGLWLMLLVAAGVNLWLAPGAFSWWTIGVGAGMGLLGELGEFLAGAVGAQRMGGSRPGAAGAIVGGLVGAIAATPFPPPVVATIVGGVVGAGLGALVVERGWMKRNWAGSFKIAGGAAAGRLVATLIKVGAAVVVAVVLMSASLIA